MVDTTAPSTPGTPTASNASATSVLLSWTPSTDDTAVTAYDIYNSTTLLGTNTADSSWITRGSGVGSGTLSGPSSICAGSGPGKYMFTYAVGPTTTPVFYTTDYGATWSKPTLPVSTFWSAVACGNGTYVAIAQNGTGGSGTSNIAASSTDGTTWTQRTLPTSLSWTGLTFAGGYFWAWAGSGVGAYSADGSSWVSTASYPAPPKGIAYNPNNGTFVLTITTTGSTTYTATSPIGGWSSHSFPTSQSWGPVAFNNGVFVALPTTATSAYATSVDGGTWTSRTMPASLAWSSLAVDNGIMYAFSASSSTAYKTNDGINWTSVSIPTSGTTMSAAGNGAVLYGLQSSGSVNFYTAGTAPASTYTATIAQGNSYSFNIKARDAAGNTSSASSSLTYNTVPTTPGTPTFSSPTATSVVLSWTASTDDLAVTAYDIYNGAALMGSSATTSYTAAITQGNTYSFTVKARDASGITSPASGALSYSTLPTAPGTPTLSSVSATSLSLTWTAGTDDVAVTSYEVRRNGSLVGTPASNSYTDSGLTANTSYTYDVRSKDAAGNYSGYSSTASFTTAIVSLSAAVTRVSFGGSTGQYVTMKSLSSPYLNSYSIDGSGNYTALTMATVPPAIPAGLEWSPDGQYLVVTFNSSPFIYVYYNNGTSLTRINTGLTLSGNSGYVAWDPTSTYFAVGITSGSVVVYKKSGTTSSATFSTVTQTAVTTISGTVQFMSWTADGTQLAVNTSSTPYLYLFSVDTNGVLSPQYMNHVPTSSVGEAQWSPDGRLLAYTWGSSPYVNVLYKTYTAPNAWTYTAATLATTPPDAQSLSWSKDGNYLAVSHTASPYVSVYQKTVSGNAYVFTKLGSSGLSLANTSYSVRYSKNYLVAGSQSAPYYFSTSAPAADTTAPTAPTVTLNSVVGHTVSMTWTINDSSTMTHLIRRNGTVIATVPGWQIYYSDVAPAANTQYTYEIGASDTAGNVNWSSSVVITTPTTTALVSGNTSSNTASWYRDNLVLPTGSSTNSTSFPGSMIYGGGKFVHCGGDHYMTSSNGLSWSMAKSSVINIVTPRVLGYGNGKYVALGSTTATAYSSDGMTWTSGTNLSSAGNWYKIAYGGGKFVAVTNTANDRTVATSTDGIAWTITASALPAPTAGANWVEVVFDSTNNIFVAVSGGGTASNVAAYSSNGTTWTSSTLPSSSAWTSAAFSSTTNTTIAVSTSSTYAQFNGTAWSTGTFTGSYATPNQISVDASTGVFYAYYPSNQYWVMTSTDGTNWTPRPVPVTTISTLRGVGGGALVSLTGGSNTPIVYILGTFLGYSAFPRPSSETWIDDSTIAVGLSTPPSVEVLQRNGTNITKKSMPNTLPIVAATPATLGYVAASPNGQYIAVSHTVSPYLAVYYYDGTSLSKVTTTMPTMPATVATQNAMSWNSDSTLLALGFTSSPYGVILQRTGSGTTATFTQVATTGSANIFSVNWGPVSGSVQYLQLGLTATPYFSVVPVTTSSGAIGSAWSNPASLPSAATTSSAWSPDGNYLAVGGASGNFINVYYRSGTTLTKLANPATLPSQGPQTLSWSADSTKLSVMANSSTAAPLTYTLSGSGASTTLTAATADTFGWGSGVAVGGGRYSPTNSSVLSLYGTSYPALSLTGAIPPDTTAPSVPTGVSAVATGNSVTVTWSASTDNVAVTGYEVFRDGVSQGTPATASFTQTVSDGSYTYTVRARDAASNWSAQSSGSSVTVDTTAPTVPIVSISGTGSSVTVSWNTNSDVALYEVFRGGISQGTTTSTSFNQTVSDGTYTYTVRARDAAGNWSAQSSGSTITVDTTPPAVPNAPTLTLAASPSRNVTAQWNANSDVALYEVALDGSSITTTSSNSYVIGNVADGTHTVSVRGRDSAGNWSSYSSTSLIAVDRTAPDTPSTPTSTRSLGSKTVVLAWNAVSDAVSYTVTRDGSTIASPTTNTYSDTVSTDGTYAYRVSATDAAGNVSSLSSVDSVVVDTTPPATPTISSAVQANGGIAVSWGSISGASSYTIYRDDVAVGTTTTTTTYDDAPSEGTYTYKVTASDVYGNESAKSTGVSGTLDLTPPSVPTVDVSHTGSSVTVSWNTNSDAALYEVFRDSVSQGTTTSTSLTQTVNDGSYTYKVRAKDAAGNWSAQSSGSDIVVDTTPPPIPTGVSASSSGSDVTVTWSAAGDATHYEVIKNGVSQGQTTSTSFTQTVSDGTYSYTVKSADSFNNWSNSSAAASISVDTTPPSVPSPSASANANLITVTWSTVTDAVSYEVFRGGVSQGTVTIGSFSQSVVSGTYVYTVRAQDSVGNWSAQSSGTTPLTVDIDPPATPTGLHVTGVAGISISFGWTADSDVAIYEILRDGQVLASRTGNSYSDTVPGDGTYVYKIRARDAAGNWSLQSSGMAVTVVEHTWTLGRPPEPVYTIGQREFDEDLLIRHLERR